MSLHDANTISQPSSASRLQRDHARLSGRESRTGVFGPSFWARLSAVGSTGAPPPRAPLAGIRSPAPAIHKACRCPSGSFPLCRKVLINNRFDGNAFCQASGSRVSKGLRPLAGRVREGQRPSQNPPRSSRSVEPRAGGPITPPKPVSPYPVPPRPAARPPRR
jgi:hypothetical protein